MGVGCINYSFVSASSSIEKLEFLEQICYIANETQSRRAGVAEQGYKMLYGNTRLYGLCAQGIGNGVPILPLQEFTPDKKKAIDALEVIDMGVRNY